MKHHLIASPYNAHSVGFRSVADPALTPSNEVQPNSIWVQVDGADVILAIKVRNAANSAWTTFSTAPSGAAGGVLGGTYPNPAFAVDMATQAELDAAYAAAIARANHTGTQLAATISDLTEVIQDMIGGGFLVAGTNITLTYNDVAGTLTIDASGATPALVRLDHQTVGVGGAATLTTNPISGAYRDLIAVLHGRSDEAATSSQVRMTLNNDASAIYDYEQNEINNATTFFVGTPAQTSMKCGYTPGANSPAGHGGGPEITIKGYSSATYHKEIMTRSGAKTGAGAPAAGDLYISNLIGWYRSTAAITRADFSLVTGGAKFAQGFEYSLYGRL